MATRKAKPVQSVDALLAGTPPPLRAGIDQLREIIASVSDKIDEEVKWNSPSFRIGEHFATIRLNGKVPIQLILHLGAKKAALPSGAIQDPDGLLQWLGPDRACIDFAAPGDVGRRADSLKAILGQWIQYVPARATG